MLRHVLNGVAKTHATFSSFSTQHVNVHVPQAPGAQQVDLARMLWCKHVAWTLSVNVAKRVQHHATSKMLTRKIWPFSNLIQHHPTCCNISQQGGQTYATCCAHQCCKMLRAFGLAFTVYLRMSYKFKENRKNDTSERINKQTTEGTEYMNNSR